MTLRLVSLNHTVSEKKGGNSMAALVFFYLSAILASFTLTPCNALDTMDSNKSLTDGQTLVSAGGDFELGFFSPTNSNTSRYIGIWYKKLSVKTVIWVANREAPLFNTLGTLNMTDQGLLVLYNSTKGIVWSSNASAIAQDPIAQLLNTGNLVVRNHADNSIETLWQSFDYPSDSLIAGMKISINLVTGFQTYLSSWKSMEDPAEGGYFGSIYQTSEGYPQLVIRKGNSIIFRAGSWNGITLTGVPRPNPNFAVPMEFIFNEKEISFKHTTVNGSPLLRYMLNPSGMMQRVIWDERMQEWYTSNVVQGDQCEVYAFCGAFSICNVQGNSTCGCMNGFIQNSTTNQSTGCVRRVPLNCSDADGFITYTKVKLPDTSSTWYNKSIDLNECEHLCLQNCSCTAYANLDIRGTGCLLWFNELIDVRALSGEAQDLYVRVAASELGNRASSNKKKLIGITVSLVVALFAMLILGLIFNRRRYLRNNEKVKEDIELPLFNLSTIAEATNNFSSSNMLGEGGFGPVYKGVLVDGQEIAIKRLSQSSNQGLNEFKNEIILIAKLQHRNLVKLLGCCIREDEKILIYEYMPNKSLDSFIFDQARGKLLGWSKRFNIINGIARGLLYLHQDSRLRIIHRDLKTSNILLDNEMNSKISDFGLARISDCDQSQVSTKRIVGTYGYMAPEYAVDGLLSIKSDVFSFGVIILEVISGKKNRGFSHPDHDLNLLGHAWTLCTEGRPMELLDECLKESSIDSEVTRCIHVALLCVQQRPEDRPTMSSALVMLTTEIQLPEPKLPGFYMGRNPPKADTSSSTNQSHSANTISMTLLEGR